VDEALQVRLAALADEVRAAPIADDSKHTALWCLGQLPRLYGRLRETGEARYGDEIARLVRGVLADLRRAEGGSPAARGLAAVLPQRLRLLHEEFGLPQLDLKLPAVARPRQGKAG